METKERIDGVVIGVMLGLEDSRPLVVFAGNPKDHAIAARSLVPLGSDDAGAEVALLFEDGDLERPLIIGRIVEPETKDDTPHVIRDGERVSVTGQERIELRVGKASIIMEKDGHITIRGTYLVSHASAANRIRGGSVNLN
ncbi:DUF6484 domain-containing protein [Aliiroseovarius sp. YM-037]|uniref:DUF6484 domain-containing protein n=1 Tax=Aliiroseovarius sp. YM-037 TaxID=3341728 RepID=UPI003A80F6B0